MPEALAALAGLPERLSVLPNDLARVQDFIKGASRA
jgi:hypothetical protein